MATPFQGYNTSNVQNYRIAELVYATAGFAFNHATEAGTIGLRKNAKLSRKAATVMDAAGRDIVDQIQILIEAEGLQSGLANLKNAKILSSAFHQLRLKDDSGKYFNFIDFAGTFGTPTGSTLLGLNFEWTLGQNERMMKYMWEGNIPNTVWDWVLTNSGAAETGATGGTSGGLAASAYARSSYKRSNIKDITVDGVSIGVKKDFKLVIKSDAKNRDQWNRPICRQLLHEMEVVMLQTTANDLLGVSTTGEQLDKQIIVTTWEDETITYGAGCLSIVGETETSDENAFTKLVMKGATPYSDTAITTLTSSAATFALVGY